MVPIQKANNSKETLHLASINITKLSPEEFTGVHMVVGFIFAPNFATSPIDEEADVKARYSAFTSLVSCYSTHPKLILLCDHLAKCPCFKFK